MIFKFIALLNFFVACGRATIVEFPSIINLVEGFLFYTCFFSGFLHAMKVMAKKQTAQITYTFVQTVGAMFSRLTTPDLKKILFS